ncbi:MAG: phage major capsid protein [Ruminococcus sp.]|nr:phage major capsid protein [Ruminococcus sp.]
MTSLDMQNEKKAQLASALAAAMKNNDETELARVFGELSTLVQDKITAEANELGASMAQDSTILASRGYRQLTAAETKFYMALGNAFKSGDPKMALNGAEAIMPETIIEAVLQDIKKKHPLLEHINLVNTYGAVKLLVNTAGTDTAVWGKLTEDKKKEISASIEEIDTQLLKLTAYLPVPKAIKDLGPVWLDSYVRTMLSEAIALGCEKGVIEGSGKDEPIGMTRVVGKEAVVTNGGYSEKEAVAVTDLSIETYGTLLGMLATNSETGDTRDIDDVILVCNPVDYFTKVMKATSMLIQAGTYVKDILPFPTTIIRSAAVPKGKAIIGIGSRYFLGVGNSKNGTLEYDDSVQFLEDNRVYMSKLYANGRPLDNNAFILLDISGLEPLRTQVTTWTEAPDAAAQTKYNQGAGNTDDTE